MLSYDVALEPEHFDDAPFARDKYAEAPFDIPYRLGSGFIPNYKNAVKVFANCVENHAFHRFPRACAESVSFHDGIDCSIIDNREVEKRISAIVSPTSKECNIMHILSSDFDELLGWDALVIGNETEPVAAFAISINKFGFVDEIWKLNSRTSLFGYDEELHALAMLEYGMCSCKADILREYLAEKCIYRSEYNTDEYIVDSQPDCTNDGSKSYHCRRCDSSDETSSVAIGKTGHSLKKTDKKDATCTEDGYEAYWTCEKCERIFSDEAAENEITAPVVIPATGEESGGASSDNTPSDSSNTGSDNNGTSSPENSCESSSESGNSDQNTVPKTADGTDVALMLALVIISGLAFAAVLVVLRKRENA